ncbi:MAG: hypothetical protein LBK64_05055 [Spirochaetaceae bacterium]|nr:hypothetical protein [Spirochaetaceae bacterium]
MKKIAIVLVIGLCVGLVGVFADHPGGTGIGVLFRSGYNMKAKGSDGFDIGLSLKLSSVPAFWGLALNIHDGVFGAGVTGDYYFIDNSLIKDSAFNLGWYLGLGGYGSLRFDNDMYLAGGGRLPVGLSFQFAKHFEAFLGVAYNLGLRILPSISFPAHFFNGELGFRVWL